jgi:hypothetical protein
MSEVGRTLSPGDNNLDCDLNYVQKIRVLGITKFCIREIQHGNGAYHNVYYMFNCSNLSRSFR